MIVAKLDHGEDLFGSIEKLIEEHGLESALVLSGIGMLSDFTLGYFNQKEYEWKHIEEPMELVSLHGSIAGGSIHLHCAVVGPDHMVRGGHLKEARVCVLNELVIRRLDRIKLGRGHNPRSGLAEMTVGQG